MNIAYANQYAYTHEQNITCWKKKTQLHTKQNNSPAYEHTHTIRLAYEKNGHAHETTIICIWHTHTNTNENKLTWKKKTQCTRNNEKKKTNAYENKSSSYTQNQIIGIRQHNTSCLIYTSQYMYTRNNTHMNRKKENIPHRLATYTCTRHNNVTCVWKQTHTYMKKKTHTQTRAC